MNSKGTFAIIGGSAVILTIFIGYTVVKLFGASDSFISVAMLILVGLGAFMGIMNFLSFSAQWIGISDPRQPFGLPEGTVRAILTIAFIVLVGVLASFLLANSGNHELYVKDEILIKAVPATEVPALQQKLSAEGLVIVVPITPATNPATSDIHFYARRDYRLADDVAKQILTILSTILAAMIGFYFGARPGDGSARAEDPAERSRMLAELNTLAARAPTVQTIRVAIADKLKTDPSKKPQTDKLEGECADIERKIEEARKSLGDLSVPIEKARATLADAKTAVARLAGLSKELQAI